jgi:membrane associated rhomboid family serine protease
MEQHTDVATQLERADALLREERVNEAAAEYARIVQMYPAEVGGHLGLAEANLALGQYGIVYVACRHVQQLAPGSADAAVADAILAVLDRRYEAANDALERAIELDPTRPYVHALRAYVLRRMNRRYDAALVEARAARLASGKRDWDSLFPRVEQPAAAALPADVPPPESAPGSDQYAGTPHRIGYRQQYDWQRAGGRQMTRLRFLLRTTPAVTYALIAVNVVIFVLELSSIGHTVLDYGAQIDQAILSNPLQAYRFVTAMFLHDGIAHIALNMLSLFFVGVITERIFGAGRYTLIYFVCGIVGGLTQFGVDVMTHSLGGAVGASGAIFGIFGAFGAFILMRRRALGPAGNSILGQWLFWLVINLAFGFYAPGIAIWDHLGGLAAGLIIGALLTPSIGRRR